jgi:hypothetical protein
MEDGKSLSLCIVVLTNANFLLLLTGVDCQDRRRAMRIFIVYRAAPCSVVFGSSDLCEDSCFTNFKRPREFNGVRVCNLHAVRQTMAIPSNGRFGTEQWWYYKTMAQDIYLTETRKPKPHLNKKNQNLVIR